MIERHLSVEWALQRAESLTNTLERCKMDDYSVGVLETCVRSVLSYAHNHLEYRHMDEYLRVRLLFDAYLEQKDARYE